MMSLIAKILAALGLISSSLAQSTAVDLNPMAEMRARVLKLTANEIGITREKYPNHIWGFLMDTGLPDGHAYSLIALADGTTSIYFSSGGGIIGAGGHDGVRKATGALLDAANRYHELAASVSSFPLPSAGQVTFYFLSFAGVVAYSASEDALGHRKDKLSELFHVAHEVIGAARLAEQSKSVGSSK